MHQRHIGRKRPSKAPISRSENMSRIRAKNTKPEMLLRKELHARGRRYRLHVKGLPGKPDIVFTRARLAIFVHGCFWHQHESCIQASKPKSNQDYWSSKLSGNIKRDRRNRDELSALGFRTAVLWECEIEASPQNAADLIEHLLARRIVEPKSH